MHISLPTIGRSKRDGANPLISLILFYILGDVESQGAIVDGMHHIFVFLSVIFAPVVVVAVVAVVVQSSLHDTYKHTSKFGNRALATNPR